MVLWVADDELETSWLTVNGSSPRMNCRSSCEESMRSRMRSWVRKKLSLTGFPLVDPEKLVPGISEERPVKVYEGV